MGRSSRPMMFINVDLPEPEAPTRRQIAAVHVKVAAVDDGEFALIANIEAFDNIAHLNKAMRFCLQAVHILRVLPANDLGKILCVVTHPASPAALPNYGSCRGCSARCHHS